MTQPRRSRILKLGAGFIAAFLMLSVLARQRPSSQFSPEYQSRAAGLSAAPPPSVFEVSGAPSARIAVEQMEQTGIDSSGPLIIRDVSLSFTSQNISGLRARIDTSMRRFNGHIERFAIESNKGTAESLSAKLRIPFDQLDGALAELRTLETLTEETESSQDVTAGYTDLVARLSNKKRTEQRLPGLLSDRTGKLSDVVLVEKTMSDVREEIERMEAQQRRSQNQVRFAAVSLNVTTEDRNPSRIALVMLRAAFTDGFHAAVDNSFGIALAILRYGPSFIIYFLVLSPLICIAWRKWKASAPNPSSSPAL
jgi:Domain of unknown function (DUF4349)